PDIRSKVRQRIDSRVAEGFDSADQIQMDAVEEFSSTNGVDEIDVIVRQELAEATVANRAAQKMWPQVTDCDRLDAAFEKLNEMGITARHNWSCCGNCGRAEMPDELERLNGEWQGTPIVGYSFYHMQDTERAALDGSLYLSYGSTESAKDDAAYE